MSLSGPSYFGYLTFEEVPGSDVFVRRFFVIDKSKARLEYYADDSILVANTVIAKAGYSHTWS